MKISDPANDVHRTATGLMPATLDARRRLRRTVGRQGRRGRAAGAA